jgi:hypothetical protein
MASNYILTNVVSAAPINNNVAECNSWVLVNNNAGRPLFSHASYITNFDDLSVSLSASNINIGSVHITDTNTNLAASVADIGIGLGALRVLSQDLEPVHDTVSIGDINGNNVKVNSSLSALNVYVTNPVTSFTLLNTSIEIANDIGNAVPVNITNSIQTTPEPTQLDAFGRLRVSTPLTLFDSSNRYRDNNLFASLTANGGIYAFNTSQGLVDLTVNSSSGSSVIRESTKTFSYQPGKSLLVLNTFVMGSSATNFRQRVGYFGSDNGIYFQLDDDVISFVKRSSITGSLVDSVVPRSSWNGDKLDGTGASGLILDITKAQILWTDIEWLGVGSVRVGFVINGQYIICHTFNHANIIASTYITTASLPIRYEITNKGATSGSHTLKQICSSVISEGGYELRGLQQSVGIPITSPYALATAGTLYPIITLRLKSTRLDAIIILTALSFIGKSNAYYNWKVIASGITSGGSGTWISAGVDSAVEYKLDASSISGGRVLAGGFCTTSVQGSTQVDILKEALFSFQLERDTLNGVQYELTLCATSDTNTSTCYAAADWEEISR